MVNGNTITSVTLASAGAAASATVTTPGPTYAIVASAATGSGLGNYNILYANGTLTIGVKSITVTASNRTKIYGAELILGTTAFSVPSGALVNGNTITSVTLTSAGAAASATVTTPGPTYPIVASAASGSGLGNYTIAYTNGTLTITPAPLCVTYNGDLFLNTQSNNTPINTAQVNLSLYVKDNGDIANRSLATAVIVFNVYKVSGATATYLFSRTGIYQAGANTTEALFKANFTSEVLSLSNLNVIYKVDWTISGNYSAGDCGDKDALITVSFPTSEFVTGGGYVLPTNNNITGATPTGANAGVKNNFGFNMKYNNRMTNLQGNFNTIVRRGNKVYHIKSNNPASLTVNTTTQPYSAILTYGSVVIQEIVDNVVVWSVGGNTAVIQVVDNGEPGSTGQTATPDRISIHIRDKNGLTWYSNTAPVALQSLAGGNIQVRTAATTTPPTTAARGGEMTTAVVDEKVVAEPTRFGLEVFGNPTATSFKVKASTDKPYERITLTMLDMSGRLMEVRTNVMNGQLIEFGNQYRSGTYFVEARQGNNRKVIKLIKNN